MEQTNLESLREAGLLPHQAQFIVDFLAPGSPPYQQLMTPTGAGKSIMVSELTDRLIVEHHAVRVLILTTRLALQRQFLDILRQHVKRIPVIGIDKRAFRGLEASVDVGLSPWDRPIVAVMTLDLAKQEDIANSLAAVKWDLVVVDEAHGITGQRKELIDRLIDSGAIRRLLLFAAIPSADALSLPGLVTTKWSRDIVDWEGHPLFKTSRERRVVVYRRGSDEVDFLRNLKQLSKELIDDPVAALQRSLLLRVAASSLYAIELSLLRQRNRLAHGMPFPSVIAERDLQSESTLEEAALEEALDYSIWANPASALARITTLIEDLDGISSDEKLQSLLALVEKITTASQTCRVCIFSSFIATVSYLYSSLRDAGTEAYQFTGAMSYKERDRAYHRFTETGGVLVASSVATTGLDLAHADVGINYDLSASRLEMEQRWGRIDRPGRTGSCIMYAFKDMSGVIPLEAEALRLHGFEES